MTSRRKQILLVAASVSLVMIVFPPYHVEIQTEMGSRVGAGADPMLVREEFYGYKFFLASPPPAGAFWGYRYRVDYRLLLAQGACLWLVAAGVLGRLRIRGRQ